MVDKVFPTSSGFFPNLFQELAVNLRRHSGQVVSIQIAQWSVLQGMLRDGLGPNGYLYPFDGINDQEPKLAIKGVALPDCVKRCAGLQFVVGVADDTKGVPVGAESIVTDGLQYLDQLISVSDESAFEKEIGLLSEAERWLRIFHNPCSL